jgi:hypothetical protein
MKTIQTLHKIIVIISIVVISIFITSKAEAQCSCPYYVTNNLTCTIVVKFESVHGTNPVTACNTINNASITSGATRTFACGVGAGCTASPTNCRVTILSVNGTNVNQWVDQTTQNISFVDCTGTANGASATWTSTVTTIN